MECNTAGRENPVFPLSGTACKPTAFLRVNRMQVPENHAESVSWKTGKTSNGIEKMHK